MSGLQGIVGQVSLSLEDIVWCSTFGVCELRHCSCGESSTSYDIASGMGWKNDINPSKAFRALGCRGGECERFGVKRVSSVRVPYTVVED